MNQLSIEKFEGEQSEIAKLATKYQGLEIKGVEDTKGYAEVDAARKELKSTRVRIQKTGKQLREEANLFSRRVIEVEKGIVALIEPTERDLQEKQDAIDMEKERQRRVDLLPRRKERLAEVGAGSYNDDELLGYDDPEFEQLIVRERQMKLERDQAALEEERQKVEDEKRKIEEEKQAAEAEKKRLADLEKARKEAAEQAKKEAEAEKQRAITAERERAEKEKQAIIDRQEAEEKARKEAEEKAKAEAEARAEAEKAEQERLEKREKYTEWLKKNGYSEENKEGFKIERDGNTFTIWKKVDEITI